MAKAYTDLEQSKRLAEFLPLDSADGFWEYHDYLWYSEGDEWEGYEDYPIAEPYLEYTRKENEWKEDKSDIPCWSLTALLNVLPKPTKRIYELNIYGGDEKPFFGFNDCDMNIHKGFEGDDYVDACVNMIVYIHEKLNEL